MKTKQIHLLWQGPHELDAILEMTGPTDRGVYQVCGSLPAYGWDALGYIGKAQDQSFADRLRRRVDNLRDPWAENSADTRIYTGRIHGIEGEGPDLKERGELIAAAERLLIAAHSPAWNSQGVTELKPEESGYGHFHVFNWGQYGRLLPEVSGARYGYTVWNRIDEDPLGTAPSTE